jgi:hypothetical protein
MNNRIAFCAVIFAAGVLPVCASQTYQVNFTDSQNIDSGSYTGDQSNWIETGCGTSASPAYNYCEGDLLGDLLTGTRAGLVSPNIPFDTVGFQFDILNAQSAIIALVLVEPANGCSGSGGTVTCGLSVQFLTSQNGGPISSALLSSLASIPVSGSVIANGTNQTAYTLSWSDGRVDTVNFTLSPAPEPSTAGMIVVGVLLGVGLRRRLFTAIEDKTRS